jgi:excisionase family DNA binding protein
MTPDAPTPALLDVNGVARILAVSPETLKAWRKRGEGPPAYRLGRLVRWRTDDVDRWLASRREHSASHKPVGVESGSSVLHGGN